MKDLRAGLIGWPVGHSLSPDIFRILGRLTKTKIEYGKYPVKPEDLDVTLRRLRRLAGCNVTIPHKQAVLPWLQKLTPVARAIGAVNVIRFGKQTVGHNTDAAGFADALRETGVKVKGADAVVYGAGGAARAVCYALGRMGARRVTIVARNTEKAKAAARDIGKAFPKTRYGTSKKTVKAKIHVNATPLGMKGFPQKSPTSSLPGCELAYDLVYGRKTPFLLQAAACGVGSEGMLVYQALRAWQFWGGGLGGRTRKALKNDIIRGLWH